MKTVLLFALLCCAACGTTETDQKGLSSGEFGGASASKTVKQLPRYLAGGTLVLDSEKYEPCQAAVPSEIQIVWILEVKNKIMMGAQSCGVGDVGVCTEVVSVERSYSADSTTTITTATYPDGEIVSGEMPSAERNQKALDGDTFADLEVLGLKGLSGPLEGYAPIGIPAGCYAMRLERDPFPENPDSVDFQLSAGCPGRGVVHLAKDKGWTGENSLAGCRFMVSLALPNP